MVVIVQEELMVFSLLEMAAHHGREELDKLLNLPIVKAGNEGLKELIPAEELEEGLD